MRPGVTVSVVCCIFVLSDYADVVVVVGWCVVTCVVVCCIVVTGGVVGVAVGVIFTTVYVTIVTYVVVLQPSSVLHMSLL